MYSVNTKLVFEFKYYGKYLYLYLNNVQTLIFAIVFVFGKFTVFVFVFKYYAMYLDPSLLHVFQAIQYRVPMHKHYVCKKSDAGMRNSTLYWSLN